MSDLLREMGELERVLRETPVPRLDLLFTFCDRQRAMASPPSAEFWGALAGVVGHTILDLRRAAR